MNPNKNLTVLTAIKEPGFELELTYNSLKTLVDEFGNNVIRWIIADGSEHEIPIELVSAWSHNLREVVYKHEKDHGIYYAINKCLEFVGSEPFIIIHAGDILKECILEEIPKVNELVICGQADWHDSSGRQLRGRKDKKYNFNLGIMPNHQAMIFPGSESQEKYNTVFAIAADLDLKLTLARKSRFTFTSQEIASCLEGGISDRRMQLKTCFERGRETYAIYRKHYSCFHALMLGVIYQLSFLARLDLASFKRKILATWK